MKDLSSLPRESYGDIFLRKKYAARRLSRLRLSIRVFVWASAVLRKTLNVFLVRFVRIFKTYNEQRVTRS